MRTTEIIAPGAYWCRGTHDAKWYIVEVDVEHGMLYAVYPGDDQPISLRDLCVWPSSDKELEWIGPLKEPPVGWQPMVTAPKDGTLIDVWTQSGRETSVEWRVPDKCHSGASEKPATWCVVEAHYDDFHWHEVEPAPTHWMPIPGGPG